ncbi:MAG: triphosphoribosyl-dephospho-CoA synthase [Dongiaceae bacterium]
MTLPAEAVAAAYLDACLIELRALKPGNVHDDAAGHGMTVADFEAAARASADVFALPGLGVGERIYEAVRRSRAAVDCNANLGIVLLCAPLAEAALTAPANATFRRGVEAVLARLDLADAEFAFRAIRLAAPGGLGESARHDVRRPATVGLREAMSEAQARDRVAHQYEAGFADVFGLGVPRLRAGLARWGDPAWAAAAAYLGFLAAFADSHVERKHGSSRAEDVRRRAAPLDALLQAAADPAALRPALLDLDAALKREGVNPGTSADLTVASLFALGLEDAQAGADPALSLPKSGD